jgi:hypothetical protein
MSVINVDFLADWMAWAEGALRAQGYSPKAGDFMETCIRFHNLRRRLISPHPRRVHESDALTCPVSLGPGLAQLRAAVENGGALRPYLSRKLTDLDFDDSLLNDWGIYHMHLGSTVDPQGFVTRTGPVLLARFDADDAYFIAIENHGAWTSQNLLAILHRNWPTVTAPCRLPGVIRAEYEPSDADIATLRAGRISPIATVAGLPLAPMGGGLAQKGGAAAVSFECTKLAKRLRSWEKVVRERVEGEPGHGARSLRLEIRGTDAYAVEEPAGTAFKLGAGAA